MANPSQENVSIKTSLYMQVIDEISKIIPPENIATLSEVKSYLGI